MKANKIWHDASEEPKGAEDKEILVQFYDYHTSVHEIGDWESLDHQTKWAYLDDLLNIQEESVSKDVVNDMLKSAEDHAYFAGSEAMREKMIDKAVEWLKANDIGYNYSESSYDHDDGEMIDDFRKAMG